MAAVLRMVNQRDADVANVRASGAGEEQPADLAKETVRVVASQGVVDVESELNDSPVDAAVDHPARGVAGAVFAVRAAGQNGES